jgi:hypothetical protein
MERGIGSSGIRFDAILARGCAQANITALLNSGMLVSLIREERAHTLAELASIISIGIGETRSPDPKLLSYRPFQSSLRYLP